MIRRVPDARVPDAGRGRRQARAADAGAGAWRHDPVRPLCAAARRARARTSVVQTYAELKALMRTLDGVERVIALGEPEPPADIVTPLLSLPLVFGTRLDTRAGAGAVSARAGRSGWRHGSSGSVRAPRPRVGLAWWGSQHIPKRSLPIETLLPVLSMPGHRIARAAEGDPVGAARLAGCPCRLLIDHSAELHDYRRHRGADLAARPGRDDRYLGGASRRRAGQAGMDHAAAQCRLALAARIATTAPGIRPRGCSASDGPATGRAWWPRWRRRCATGPRRAEVTARCGSLWCRPRRSGV